MLGSRSRGGRPIRQPAEHRRVSRFDIRRPAGYGRPMPVLVSLDGKLVPPEAAVVPVLDRGFLYGDSVYEVARTYRGVPFALDRHLKRLQGSAQRIGLVLPDAADLEREVARTLGAAGNPESYVRIIVTRGEGRFGLEIGRAHV